MQIDEISYLDELHAKARGATDDDEAERARAKRRFLDIVFQVWPEVSATFDDCKHSL